MKYLGKLVSLSQIIPVDIYNSTAYSVVCETNYDNHYSFYTEKIVKPIIAKEKEVAVYVKKVDTLYERFRKSTISNIDKLIDYSINFDS